MCNMGAPNSACTVWMRLWRNIGWYGYAFGVIVWKIWCVPVARHGYACVGGALIWIWGDAGGIADLDMDR